MIDREGTARRVMVHDTKYSFNIYRVLGPTSLQARAHSFLIKALVGDTVVVLILELGRQRLCASPRYHLLRQGAGRRCKALRLPCLLLGHCAHGGFLGSSRSMTSSVPGQRQGRFYFPLWSDQEELV